MDADVAFFLPFIGVRRCSSVPRSKKELQVAKVANVCVNSFFCIGYIYMYIWSKIYKSWWLMAALYHKKTLWCSESEKK